MSLAHAWNILMWSIGWIVVLYLVVCFIHILTTSRYQRGWDRMTKRWPNHGGHSEHFFRDLKTWPEE